MARPTGGTADVLHRPPAAAGPADGPGGAEPVPDHELPRYRGIPGGAAARLGPDAQENVSARDGRARLNYSFFSNLILVREFASLHSNASSV